MPGIQFLYFLANIPIRFWLFVTHKLFQSVQTLVWFVMLLSCNPCSELTRCNLSAHSTSKVYKKWSGLSACFLVTLVFKWSANTCYPCKRLFKAQLMSTYRKVERFQCKLYSKANTVQDGSTKGQRFKCKLYSKDNTIQDCSSAQQKVRGAKNSTCCL